METEQERAQATISGTGPWLQDVRLPNGASTAPSLRGWPAPLWDELRPCLPNDLDGWSVLDVGCRSGYHCFRAAERGAEAIGTEPDALHLQQARWLRKKLGMHSRVRFHQRRPYDLAQYRRRFDVVLLLEPFDRCRYPALALDVAMEKVDRLLVVQASPSPSDPCAPSPEPGEQAARRALVERSVREHGFDVERCVGGRLFICRSGARADPSLRAEVLSATGRRWR